MRASLPAVTPAAPPAKARWYAPAMALTAAAVLVGAFAFGPTGNAVPWGGEEPRAQAVGSETEVPPPVLRDRYGRIIVPAAPRR